MEISEYLQENGEEVQCISYSDMQDFKKKVKDIMKFLRNEKIEPSDVAFLAPKKYQNSFILQEPELELCCMLLVQKLFGRQKKKMFQVA